MNRSNLQSLLLHKIAEALMTDQEINRDRITLGVQQPWAELIMRGIKTIEVRSSNTQQRGLIYIYSSKKFSRNPKAAEAIKKHGLNIDELETGKLLGSVEIIDSKPCEANDSVSACLGIQDLSEYFSWHLNNPQPFVKTVDVKYLPYGVWFYPFKRKNQE